ncbi:PhnD/SsuA/transferrin family substrate-binding protein [Brucella rhizosphaerae]|uniref:PhnD/SsuA/transferrin family substrate-binding protein n=1 Tax=Brucella rhizosphaerae TaxID=571254 RepID=UPI003644BFAC
MRAVGCTCPALIPVQSDRCRLCRLPAVAMMASKDGAFGYEMEIITYPGSGVEKIEDLKGKKLAFTAETSNSGFKAPSALLKSEYKLEAGKDLSRFSRANLTIRSSALPTRTTGCGCRQFRHEAHDRP